MSMNGLSRRNFSNPSLNCYATECRSGKRPGSPMNATGDPASQARLVAALVDPAVFGPGCKGVRHLETHISHVLLTGAHAYKIKKPVDLGFLDFTTLAQRKRYCEQELRLNRRLAPAIYLDVVAITGSVDRPVIGGDGPVVEYAVKMREFAQEALASRMLAAGALGAAHVDALAAEVAAFHGRVETAGEGTRFGSPDTILRVALQNFDSIRPMRDDPADRERQDALRAWTEREHALRLASFERRRADGFVRECHGDLHLNNIAVIDGEVTVFDCIEFNDELRWIDVMSEIAFTTMDLADRGRPDLAHRFVNAYLESTGDYAGLAVFPFYLVYRAMVRAKIACLRLGQLRAGRGENGARRRIPRLRRSRHPLRAGAASGDRRHARTVRVRQDHTDARVARMDWRDPHSYRRRAQAAARPSTRGRAAGPGWTRACTLPMQPSAPTAARWSSPKRSRRRVVSRSSTARSSSAGSAISSVPARPNSGSRS